MKVGYSPVLKIDPEFKSLMHPLSEKEFLSLRENILDGGTTYSIAAWNEYLIDGYERYMICRQENIPYHVHRIGFSCREHAITWICREQLKKGNLTNERYRYLIGKRYETERIVRNDSGTEPSQQTSHNKLQNTNSYRTALKLGEEYSLSHNTVYKYGVYSRMVDIIMEKDADLAQKILSGKLRVSHDNIIELSRLPQENIKRLNKTLSKDGIDHIVISDILRGFQWKRVVEPRTKTIPQEEIPIKQMPQFDPNAAPSSLAYTMPSWEGTIKRIRNETDFQIVSEDVKNKLAFQIRQLQNTLDTLSKKMEDNSNE